tara:strand:- start:5429 stop:5695 length:267 start_codon:yes stop_codon:yes gene_type:complete
MPKLSEYSIIAVPTLYDLLIGTKGKGTPKNATYNFTVEELLVLFETNFDSKAIVIKNTYEYLDNQEALNAGLSVGQIYRTGDKLKIVH